MLRALDLFCCAGGATKGLQRAGFHVTGVDIEPQPRYCGDAFVQADALTFSLRDERNSTPWDFVWASPPCQRYTNGAKQAKTSASWPDLIHPIRNRIRNWATYAGGFYAIENVASAPLLHPVILCGTMFPNLRVLRHRLFEANFEIVAPAHKKHPKVHTFDKRKSHFGKTDEWKDFVQVTGGGNCSLAAARVAMGIDWMTKAEINEAIPPAYSDFIGRAAIAHIQQARQAA